MSSEARIRALLAPRGQRPRAAIFLSGSGSNAERVIERWQGPGRECFEIACLVTDRPERSRAGAIAAAAGLPLVALDIFEFYRARGEKRVNVATPAGRRLRQEWTDELRTRLAPFAIDFGLFAGFVPLCNIAADFPCLNVHPGDLTYQQGDRRVLVGLHTLPIELAIREGLDYLRASVILAEPYTGQGEDMDSGLILGVSGKVAIDFGGSGLEHLQTLAANRPAERPSGGYRDLLEEVAAANQERLKQFGDWVVFPPVVLDFAASRFGTDGQGGLFYRETLTAPWQPILTVEYTRDGHTLLPRA